MLTQLLNEEQYLDLAKLRNYARHGIHPQVRGVRGAIHTGSLAVPPRRAVGGQEWVTMLTTGQEMTAVRNKFLEYESVSKRIPVMEKQIRTEVLRYYRQRLHPKLGNHQRFGVSSRCANLRSHTRPAGIALEYGGRGGETRAQA